MIHEADQLQVHQSVRESINLPIKKINDDINPLLLVAPLFLMNYYDFLPFPADIIDVVAYCARSSNKQDKKCLVRALS